MWFWNNSINVKVNERSQPTKIHHVIDIEKLLGVDNLDEFITLLFNNLTDLIIFASNVFSTFSSSLTSFLSINYIT